MIVTAADKSRFNAVTGLYEVCIFGLKDSSVAITPSENTTSGRYPASDSILYTINIPSQTSV
jgi:hypothetical protein